MQRATTAKQNTEIADAKEQARLDILAWISDKTSKNEDATLDNNKVKEILTDKPYVKEAKAKSFITAKGEYEIPYSELYQLSNQNVDKYYVYFEHYADTYDIVVLLNTGKTIKDGGATNFEKAYIIKNDERINISDYIDNLPEFLGWYSYIVISGHYGASDRTLMDSEFVESDAQYELILMKDGEEYRTTITTPVKSNGDGVPGDVI